MNGPGPDIGTQVYILNLLSKSWEKPEQKKCEESVSMSSVLWCTSARWLQHSAGSTKGGGSSLHREGHITIQQLHV